MMSDVENTSEQKLASKSLKSILIDSNSPSRKSKSDSISEENVENGLNGQVNQSYTEDVETPITTRPSNDKKTQNKIARSSVSPTAACKTKNRTFTKSISTLSCANIMTLGIGQSWRGRSSADGQSPWRMDHASQPILDVSRKASQAHMDDAAGKHRNVYVGMHLPSSHKHKHHKHHKHKRGNKKSYKYDEEDQEPMILPPNQQVQFILGTDQQDGCVMESIDGTPCIFTEMEELKIEDGGETVWKETARWIKFEEVVEDGGDRWSKPHVATLSLHSLFELRSCILKGVVQLDMVAHDLNEIADLVLDQMVSQGQLPHDDEVREKVRTALLSGHEHQGEKKKGVTAIKSMADLVSRSSDHDKKHHVHSSTAPDSMAKNKSLNVGSSFNNGSSFHNGSSFADTDKKCKVPYFMKKIPTGAEASNVLIGEVGFLEQKIIALVRLRDSVHLDRLTEVPIPTRFIFILLGPMGNYKQYHEIGRSIATLMADEVFHEVAYKAKTRTDLLAGVDEFLDEVTVLPPGEWDANIRIEPPKDLPGNQIKRLEKKPNGAVFGHGEPQEVQVHTGPELQRTGRLFGGLVNDIKRKAPFFISDFKDCLSIQCLASFIFLYFAILTPIVTFGGLLGDATHNYIGTMESIFGAAMSGFCFHLFSGQPLTIIGSTGPILVFEKIMFEICTSVGLEYVSFRWWVGLWTGLICIGLVAFDASSLISYVTRYTEESFSALISFIFIYEAFKKLIHEGDKLKIWYGWDPDLITLYGCDCIPPVLDNYNITNSTIAEMKQASVDSMLNSHHANYNGLLYKTGNETYSCAFDNKVNNISSISTIDWGNLTKKECLSEGCGTLYGQSCIYTPDAIFMSIILFFGTFFISMTLKGLKTSRYFPTKVRSIISDFAVTIAIGLMVLFDILMRINTSKLIVPESFRPTRNDRSWFIDPFGKNPWWSCLLAIIPSLLATILIFMDQQITAVIVNRKENKLKKGCGYHLDLLVVSIMLIICSIMGLPWFVAATVLSITHVNSLRMETETSAPGEAPKFLGVREQRVTGLMIFLMIGVSVFITPILAYIPMPVLYGVFLYMGVSSLKGVQFFDRMKLYLMPPKHQPDFIYLRHVPLPKVYLFTAFQAMGLVVLWIIKSTSPVSIVFPMMVAALVGVRKLFDYGIFTQQELKWLDDLMPESTKKRKEDARKKKEKEMRNQAESDVLSGGAGTVNVPLNDGKVLSIPVSEIQYDPNDPTSVNISKEMSQTAIWKTIAKSEIGSNSSSNVRNRSRSSKNSNSSPKNKKKNGSLNLDEAKSPSSGDVPNVIISFDANKTDEETGL